MLIRWSGDRLIVASALGSIGFVVRSANHGDSVLGGRQNRGHSVMGSRGFDMGVLVVGPCMMCCCVQCGAANSSGDSVWAYCCFVLGHLPLDCPRIRHHRLQGCIIRQEVHSL